MVGLETDPAVKKFLETTKAELEARYAKKPVATCSSRVV
jgi:hypothetical protein